MIFYGALTQFAEVALSQLYQLIVVDAACTSNDDTTGLVVVIQIAPQIGSVY